MNISKLKTQNSPTGQPYGPKLKTPAVLFVVAFLVRLVYALQITFPPLDDPAYYIQAARALSGPRPWEMEVGIIWNFQPLFENVRHPGMEFWMPLSSLVIGFFLWLLGDTFFAAQLPSLIAGSLLPIFTWFFARRFMPDGLSFVAGLLVALNPLLVYQSALPDSSMLYAALVCPALLLLTRFREKPRPTTALAFGLLTGLAYLARTPAVFLVATAILFTIYAPKGYPRFTIKWRKSPEIAQPPQNRQSSIFNRQSSILALLAMAVVVGAWSLRNWLLFGFVTSPAGTQTIFLFDYQDLFNYRTPINFQTWLDGGLGKIIGLRLEALWSAWRTVLDALTPPTALLGVIGLGWLAKRESAARPAALYSLLLFLGVPLIFAVASLNGSYYHSAASSAPFLAAGQVFLVWHGLNNLRLTHPKHTRDLQFRRGKAQSAPNPPSSFLRPRSSVLVPPSSPKSSIVNRGYPLGASIILAVLVLINVLLLVLNFGPVTAVHRQDADLYGRIKIWLVSHPASAVITNQPATLNYVSGQPSVRLPANEDLATLREVANKYKASYIIITEQAGRYPALLDAPENKLFPLVHQGGDFEVFAVPSAPN